VGTTSVTFRVTDTVTGATLDRTFSIVGATPLYAFTSPFTFTTTGITGPSGPTITQLRAAYSSDSWTQANASGGPFLNVAIQGIQDWTVPSDGTYEIAALGADGGDTTGVPVAAAYGGRGAYMRGEFTLTKNSVIKILVGHKGSTVFGYTSGGGGGTFVIYENGATDTPLVIAGGGGGGGLSGGDGIDATTSFQGYGGNHGLLAASGYAPTSNSNSGWGTGGGGYYSSPVSTLNYNVSINAKGFIQGGNGAQVTTQSSQASCIGGWGGFGGGGGGGCNGGGGGGGWSGGRNGGGSGGSYLSAGNGFIAGNTYIVSGSSVPTNSSYPGAGYVVITKL